MTKEVYKKIEGIFNVNRKEFDIVEIDRNVLLNATKLAKTEFHPAPIIALLEGYVENRKLKIGGLKMLSDELDFTIDLPFATNAVGSLQSHPEGGDFPEKHELDFFDRTGGVHFILSNPYTTRNMKAFDRDGNKLNFFVR